MTSKGRKRLLGAVGHYSYVPSCRVGCVGSLLYPYSAGPYTGYGLYWQFRDAVQNEVFSQTCWSLSNWTSWMLSLKTWCLSMLVIKRLLSVPVRLSDVKGPVSAIVQEFPYWRGKGGTWCLVGCGRRGTMHWEPYECTARISGILAVCAMGKIARPFSQVCPFRKLYSFGSRCCCVTVIEYTSTVHWR